MAIRVVAREVLISGKRDEAIEKVLKEMVEKTREEEGCIEYGFYVDIANPDAFAMIEQWESLECLDAHRNSEHFQRLIPQMAQYVADKTRIERYEQIV